MNLPLVKYITDSFVDVDLADSVVIGAQHLLETTLDLFVHLFEKGLKPENTFLIGKCYSSCHPVRKEMQKAGIYVCPSSFKFISKLPFDNQYSKNISLFLKKILPKNNPAKRIIFLDDGGHLIKAAHKMLSDFSCVFGVEQTTSGFEALKNFDLQFPVINVARSPVKLIYESPMIAEVIAQHIYKSLDNLNLMGKKALILGGGAIGKSIYERIKGDFQATIFDLQRELSMINAEELHYWLTKSDLIIGCTGKAVLSPDHYKLLKNGVFLISASSSDREFEAFHFRSKLKPFTNPHRNIHVEGVNLLNSGFPLNFDGHKHSVPPNMIQLTRALLACGIMQGASEDALPIGIIPLDIELQRNVIGKFFEICDSEYKKIVKNIPINSLIRAYAS